MKTKVLIYNKFNRFWHWGQVFLMANLFITGFEIHGNYTIWGFEKAVFYHNVSAFGLIILTAFAIFWHLTTGMWKHYIPTYKKLVSMIIYYSYGIFLGLEKPYHKSVNDKLNPIQKIVYAGLKIFAIPVQLATGLLYFFYYRIDLVEKYLGYSPGFIKLKYIAIIHLVGCFALLSFLIVHVYMITTGETIFTNLKAMITGYEEIHESDD